MLVTTKTVKRVALVVGVVGLATTSGVAWWQVRDEAPIRTSGQDTPNPLTAGDPEAALEQARKLMDALRAANWDKTRVPFELKFLPDRYMHEAKQFRTDRQTTFSFPAHDPRLRAPEYENVAFATDLYVRKNVSHYKGDGAKSRPEGFYIVGWKDGRVEKVPVWDVRIVPSSTRRNEKIEVFPGMPGYDRDGELPAFLRSAAPPDSAVVQAAAKLRPPAPPVKSEGPAGAAACTDNKTP